MKKTYKKTKLIVAICLAVVLLPIGILMGYFAAKGNVNAAFCCWCVLAGLMFTVLIGKKKGLFPLIVIDEDNKDKEQNENNQEIAEAAKPDREQILYIGKKGNSETQPYRMTITPVSSDEKTVHGVGENKCEKVEEDALLKTIREKGILVETMEPGCNFLLDTKTQYRKNLGAVPIRDAHGNVTNVYVVYEDHDGSIKYYDYPELDEHEVAIRRAEYEKKEYPEYAAKIRHLNVEYEGKIEKERRFTIAMTLLANVVMCLLILLNHFTHVLGHGFCIAILVLAVVVNIPVAIMCVIDTILSHKTD